MDDNPNFGGIGRLFCSACGVTMMTVIFARPRTEFNDGDEEADMFCVFPATFTDKMNEFIQSWQPTHHVNCDSAILPLAAINDGLEKTRHLIQVVPTALALAALMTLILDLDRPADLTLTKVSQTAMIDLQKRLNHTVE